MIARILEYLREFDINEIVTGDYSGAWTTVVSAIRDPRANMTVAVTVFSIATLVLIAVFIAALTFILGGDDEDEYVVDGQATGAPVHSPVVVYEPEPNPYGRAIATIVWTAVFVLGWLSLGWGTSQDSVCTSCHIKTTHTLVQGGQSKPADDSHTQVSCVQCHESASALSRYGWGTLERSLHYGRGFNLLKKDEYGHVGSPACLSCHSTVMTRTIRDDVRGVKMSHKEPIEAGATCLDCHAGDNGSVVSMSGGMTRCVTCHNGKDATYECDSCHSGDVSRASGAGTAANLVPKALVVIPDCGGCHDVKRECDSCHGIRMPHSGAFKEGGHARTYVESYWFGDGKKCVKCHNEERRPCTKCHGQRFPSHAKSWAYDHALSDPQTTGCDGCHGARGKRPGRNMCIDLCHTDREDWRE